MYYTFKEIVSFRKTLHLCFLIYWKHLTFKIRQKDKEIEMSLSTIYIHGVKSPSNDKTTKAKCQLPSNLNRL